MNGGLSELSSQQQQHGWVTPNSDCHSFDQAILGNPPDISNPDSTTSEAKDDVYATSLAADGPPSKKRKLAESDTPRRSSSRAPSPPWKKAGVDGPTSFLQDGKRRSTRTNSLPPAKQPESDGPHARRTRRQHREANSSSGAPRENQVSSSAATPPASETTEKVPGGKVMANGSSSKVGKRGRPSKKRQASQSSSSTKTTKISDDSSGSYTKINGPRSSASRLNPVVKRTSQAEGLESSDKLIYDEDREYINGNTQQRLPRLRFRVKKPVIGIQHPSHGLLPRKYQSFREWLDSGDWRTKDDALYAPVDAHEEARTRLRVVDATEPGGVLSADTSSAYIPEPQEEPSQQYSHQDHLISHALYFKKLLDQEHKRHRHMAKLFAHWCADAWRKRHKRPEDILREQQEEVRGRRKQVVKDLQKMFDLARAEVDNIRLARWEEERKVEDQQALDRAIKQSTMLFEKRRQEILGETGSEFVGSSEGEEDTGTDSDSEEDGESNMSSTDSESEEGTNVDGDEALTAEELQIKYASIPETDHISDRASAASSYTKSSEYIDAVQSRNASDDEEAAIAPENVEVDQVDPVLLDGSDNSTDMDSDMGSSDGDVASDDKIDDSAEEDEDGGPGLLGFFSPGDIKLNGTEPQSEEDEDEEEPDEPDEVSLVPNGPVKLKNEHENAMKAESAVNGTIQGGEEGTVSKGSTVPVNGLDHNDSFDDPEEVQHDDREDVQDTNAQVDDEPYTVNSSSQYLHPEGQHEERHSGEASSEASPGTIATKPSDPESVSSYEAPAEKGLHPGESPAPPGLKTPLPHLLRGSLREYQHFGLDWLTGLYSNHINGILADEMGLGKTIQTIAVLAHLAVEHGMWGPHLVVVPTSVILNWEMEFKKWCPGFKIMAYYGTQEERRQKRRGWVNDNSWNVLITSYQLVLQDQQVLKRRHWHYMILDEAHNIKNFRSQRWQALLTFRTRARLLLTGTPLQNNLTELWSLLFFLMPSDGDGTGIEGFADLRNFSEWFRRPVEQILEHGRETMDEEAKQVVTKLHTVLRPYILRRLKVDVEKQMPGKYEHVVYCRLSKRQRYLYDGFMSRAQTKETLSSGNYLSIINCLMQLRKVCNHPDLFETRPISTSFAMPKSVATEFEPYERLVRRRLLYDHPLTQLDLDFLNLSPISREYMSRRLAEDSTRIMASGPLETLRERQYGRTNWQMQFDGSTVRSSLDSLENASRMTRTEELERCLYFESKRHSCRPVYGSSLIEFLTSDSTKSTSTYNGRPQKRTLADQFSSQSSILASMIMSVQERSRSMDGYVQRFACVTPAAVAANITEAALAPVESRYFSESQRNPADDPFHEAQTRLSIAFPDKRLLQYDCGKLQRLDKLLRDLKAGGHRALIFTQMTKMLDILEQFLNIHGHRYLRLDGTNRVEQRQMLMDRFNNDDRILAFILSTRSGGLGINLTGADTVIFYDLDWNPAMDKQCQDRCHRIGQTRDVHIYRFVSEYTIESNILRKANQKRMLDDVVIQEGEFNTDYFTKLDVRDMIGHDVPEEHDEASAAMDRVLGTKGGGVNRVLEQAEDKEDRDAAKNAQKEVEHADDGDFDDRNIPHGSASGNMGPGTPLETGADGQGTPGLKSLDDVGNAYGVSGEELQLGHIDDYLVRFMEWNIKDEPLVLPTDKSKKKSKKGKEHRVGKKRR